MNSVKIKTIFATSQKSSILFLKIVQSKPQPNPMKRAVFLCLFLIIHLLCFSQKYDSITGEVKNFPGGRVYLASFYGEYTRPFDSLLAGSNGKMTFALADSRPAGYYRLILAKDHYVDLIFNHENIIFKTDFNHLLDSLVIIHSLDNQVYYAFLPFIKSNRMKVDLLSTMVDLYPEDDPFYRDLCRQYQKEQRALKRYIDSIARLFPDSYVTKVMKAQQKPFMGCDLHDDQRVDFLKDHFWETVDLNDTSLLRSNVLTNLCIEYLSLYGNSKFNQEQLQNAFVQAVDKILAASMVNEVTYNFMLEYLLKGFEKYHFDAVIDHLAANYLPADKCENESLDAEVLRRLENYQKLSVGRPAPAITLNDINNNPIDLTRIRSQYILILFWASWCPHCAVILPKLKDLYDKKTYDMEIVAISVDRDEKDYKEAIEKGHYNWINGSELQGWNGKTPLDYNVYATPTMFLLDRERLIIAKPITFNELVKDLTGISKSGSPPSKVNQ